jgi:hypothetical protein
MPALPGCRSTFSYAVTKQRVGSEDGTIGEVAKIATTPLDIEEYVDYIGAMGIPFVWKGNEIMIPAWEQLAEKDIS